jgi:hypothetical protein
MRQLLFAAGCLLVLGQAFALGDTIYDSFGPGNSYNSGEGISINGSGDFFGAQSAAASFTITQPTEVTSATFAIVPGSQVDLALTQSVDGVPGDILSSFTSTSPGSTVTASTFSILINQLLPSGTYWFTASANSPTTSAAWYDENSSVGASTSTLQNRGSGWVPPEPPQQLAFSVSAAPLPSSILGGLGLLAAIGAHARSKRSSRAA